MLLPFRRQRLAFAVYAFICILIIYTITQILPRSRAASPSASARSPWSLINQFNFRFPGHARPAPFNSEIALTRKVGSDQKEIQYLKGIVQGIQQNNTVIIVPTDSEFLRLALNFDCRMRMLNIRNLLYWLRDDISARSLAQQEVQFYYHPELAEKKTPRAKDAETPVGVSHTAITEAHIRLLRLVLSTGYNVLFLDPHTAILKNPLEALQYDADLEGQIDEVTLEDAENEEKCPQMGAGAFYMKANPRTLRLLDRMEMAPHDYFSLQDNHILNHFLHDYTFSRILNRYETLSDGLHPALPYGGHVTENDDRLVVRFINADTFLNGAIWRKSVETLPGGTRMVLKERQGKWIREFEPALMHLSGVYAPAAKEWVFKELGWWSLNEDLTCLSPKATVL